MRRSPSTGRAIGRRVVAFLGAAALGVSCVLLAGAEPTPQPARTTSDETGEIRRTVDAAPRGVVEVRNVSGSVGVESWGRDAVEVVGSLGSEIDALVVERRGERVVVSVSRQLRRSASAHLELRVPAESALEIEGVQTDVRVAGVGGSVDVRVTSGTVRVKGAGAGRAGAGRAGVGRVELESVSGVLDLDGRFERARLSNVSGPIRVRGTVGELEAESVNGPMDLEVEVRESARLDSVAGPIVARLHPGAASRTEISTFSGRIELELDPRRPARIHGTTRSGRFREEVTGEAEIRDDGGGQSLVLELGGDEGETDETAEIELRTFSGDVRIGSSMPRLGVS